MLTVPRLAALLTVLWSCYPSTSTQTLPGNTSAAPANSSKPASQPSQPASQPSTAASQRAPQPVIPLPSAKNGVTLGKNTTGINYSGSERESCDGSRSCPCVAPTIFHGLTALARIGIEQNTLQQEGTPCLLADYDGNGITDAAFLEATDSSEKRVTVLLFDGMGLSSVRELPKLVTKLQLQPGKGKALLATDNGTVFVHNGKLFRMGLMPTPQQNAD